MAHRISMRSRPQHHHVYGGVSVLVTDLLGQVSGGGNGLYHHNTRLLSRYELRVNGQELLHAGVSPVDGNRLLGYLAVPRTVAGADGGQSQDIDKHGVIVEFARLVEDGMRERLKFTNHHPNEGSSLDVQVHVEADFADTNETTIGRFHQRKQIAPVSIAWDEQASELRFTYQHEKMQRATAVRVEQAPAPVEWREGTLRFHLTLDPQESRELHIRVDPIFDGERKQPPRKIFGINPTRLERTQQRILDEVPHLTAGDRSVERAWQAAVEDLASLPLGMPEGPAAPAAGIPLYQYFFARDSLTTAWQAAMATPRLLRDALTANAAHQGARIDDWRDEEPGKFIHQMRQGPTSAAGKDPFSAYYGDYAAPADFLAFLGQYYAWTGDLSTCRELLPAARKAQTWMERYGDLNGDGFLEYEVYSSQGVKNQGWKDSRQAIVDEHGRLVENPIAPCELQGYWYAGMQQVASVFFAAGDHGYALELLGKAKRLKRKFDQAFWMEDEQYYALGLGPDGQQIRSIANNAGHLLVSGILPRDRAVKVAQRLMQPDLFSGWGVRTLSSDHPAYNPFSYHVGSVWVVESGTFSAGMVRYGCWEQVQQLTRGMFDLSDLFQENRLPEVVAGTPRDAEHPHPGIYPESNEPQAWSASSVVLMVQSLLGLVPLAPLGTLVMDPHLPEWLPHLKLEGLRVGNARLDLEAWRTSRGDTKFKANVREGKLRVVRQSPLLSGASLGERVRGGVRSLL